LRTSKSGHESTEEQWQSGVERDEVKLTDHLRQKR
jgi:hypothetical protein